jgi:hypothetical protein
MCAAGRWNMSRTRCTNLCWSRLVVASPPVACLQHELVEDIPRCNARGSTDALVLNGSFVAMPAAAIVILAAMAGGGRRAAR